jgi:hypothetical protein
MLRLEAAGYPIVLHVHDEVVAEVPESFGSTTEFLRLLTTPPTWATNLPIAAKAWTRTCYAKPSLSAPSAPVATIPEVQKLEVQKPEVQKPAPKPISRLNGHTVPLEANNGVSLADLIGQPLTDGKIICPFHDDNQPSCHVYQNGFHCFACGAHGDHIDWLMTVEGKSRAEAEHILKTWKGPVTPLRRINDDERTLTFARHLWERAQPIANTLAIRYLADVRGIDVDALPTDDAALRFHPRCPFGPGVQLPCLVALYRDVETDTPAGIHRIALTEDVLCAGGKVQRRTLGAWPAPRAIKLWPARGQLFLGEGIETTLAAATRLHYHGALMRPAWAAGSANNIQKFPILPDVTQLTLLVDHDPIGEKCSRACRLRWREAGRRVTRLQTNQFGTDFNDLILAGGAA